MLEQLPLNRVLRLGFAFAVLVASTCKADDEAGKRALYSKYRSTSEVHGLHEIREAAVEWVQRTNAREKTNWLIGGPSLHVVVSRCAVPLTVKWAPDVVENEGNQGVNVICRKTVKTAHEKDWDVFVFLYKPAALKNRK